MRRCFSVHKFFNNLHSQGVAVGKNALHEMLPWLEDAFLVRLVPIDAVSELKRQVNPRKVYPVDPGLIAAFDRTGQPNTGYALETAVMIELERRSCQVAYVKTRAGYEVDFLATDPAGKRTYIQVCSDVSTPETCKRELHPLSEMLSSRVKGNFLLLSLSTTDALTGQKEAPACVTVKPAWEWLLESA